MGCNRRHSQAGARSGRAAAEPVPYSEGTSLTVFFVFFSSRRRHTRFDCDWSSDVCSSDLRGFTGKLSMVGDEPWLPYQRPPLSKKYLAGALERERLIIRPAQFFAAHQVDAHLGRRVTAIAPREHHVRLDDGLVLPYDALVLATGSRPRRLPVPGADLAGVHYLRTLADADRIRAECAPGRCLTIIGGGYIGLEVAATARGLGVEVTVLEMAERVMSRVTCPEVSRF